MINVETGGVLKTPDKQLVLANAASLTQTGRLRLHDAIMGLLFQIRRIRRTSGIFQESSRNR